MVAIYGNNNPESFQLSVSTLNFLNIMGVNLLFDIRFNSIVKIQN